MAALPERAPSPRMRRRAQRRRPSAHAAGSHDRWMVSYADFMTLLFAFFTTLYATSNVDRAKLNNLVASMQRAFVNTQGVANPAQAARPGAQAAPPPRARGTDAGADLERELNERLGRELADGRLSLDLDGRGVVISLKESGSFPVGSADLTPEAREVLTKIAATLGDLDASIRVEGHTDDVPIKTSRFASNWDLSTARAIAVMQYLAATGGLDSSRLAVSGYGEFRPRVPNDSPEHRAQNRRVDLVILNPDTRKSEEPAAQPPSTSEAPSGQTH